MGSHDLGRNAAGKVFDEQFRCPYAAAAVWACSKVFTYARRSGRRSAVEADLQPLENDLTFGSRIGH
jgi:hypothetical protein